MASVEEKYMVALELLGNIMAVLPDTKDNEPVRKLLARWAKS